MLTIFIIHLLFLSRRHEKSFGPDHYESIIKILSETLSDEHFNVTNDVIFGPCFAETAVLPREGAIADARYHLVEIWYLRQFLQNRYAYSDTDESKIVITVIVRRQGERAWSQKTIDSLHHDMHNLFPSSHFDIETIDDHNKSFTSCFQCISQLMSKTNIVLGSHGAGLNHMISMSPNNLVISTFASNLFYPTLSYFDMLAFSLGQHHYTYSPDRVEETDLNSIDLLTQVNTFVKRICSDMTNNLTKPTWCNHYVKFALSESIISYSA